jgi:hypothetical protein
MIEGLTTRSFKDNQWGHVKNAIKRWFDDVITTL